MTTAKRSGELAVDVRYAGRDPWVVWNALSDHRALKAGRLAMGFPKLDGEARGSFGTTVPVWTCDLIYESAEAADQAAKLIPELV